jgi:tyrosine-protein kinase Etk/Wzc
MGMLRETVSTQTEAPPLTQSSLGETHDGSAEQEIDVLEVVTLLLQEKKTILNFILVSVALAAIGVFFVMRPMYTAEAIFLPPQSAPGSSVSQLASQLGSLGGVSSFGGLKSPGDIYLGILSSRTIADGLIKRFDLQKVYKIKKVSDTEKKLKSRSNFVLGKDTLIAISVSDHDPRRAADLANAYLDALYEQNGRLALTEASQRRLFFEEQLERQKDALADAEVELKKTQEQTGLIAPLGQAQVEIDAIAQVHAQISSRQIALSALRQAATNQNPEVVRLQTEIDGLEEQLQRLQNDPGRRQNGNALQATAKVPALALEYVRKQREVKYREMLFELIARQYESARLDESREAPLLQVVDRAVVPDKKSGPPIILILLGGCFLGAFFGVGWVILRGYVGTLQKDPARAAKLDALRQAASLGR